jgi:hypothetical protein
VNHQLQRPALWIRPPDQRDVLLERRPTIPAPLIALVNEEVEQPVLVVRFWLAGERQETDHRGARVDGQRRPDSAAGTNVRFGERDGGDGRILGDEALLLWAHSEGQRLAPVVLCNRAQGDFIVARIRRHR